MGKVLSVVAREIREALPAVVFFMLAFHMVAVTNAAILEEHKISGATAALATVAALIVAKVILIVEKLPLARLFASRLIYNILWRTFLFGAVTTAFRIAEELIHGLLRDERIRDAAGHMIGSVTWTHFLIVQMWIFSMIFLYCLAAELARVIGPAKVRKMLLGPRPEAPA